MSTKRLLICFDAFGTLFTPKRPVHVQYAEVARAVGMSNVRDEDVDKYFKDAFKAEASQHPNFGKTVGLNAEQWWTNIITNTFRPIAGNDTQLPEDLVPKLLHRFWSRDGYDLCEDAQSLFQRLSSRLSHGKPRNVVIGVITNSDDRVPDILSSLGLRVGPLRYGDCLPADASKPTYDVDFTVLSFDVGHEKPRAEIFRAAEETLLVAVGQEHAEHHADWDKIYVGDEYKKDVVGALSAGWKAVLVGPHDEVRRHEDVRWLDDQPVTNLLDAIKDSNAVGFSRLGKFAEWLPKDI